MQGNPPESSIKTTTIALIKKELVSLWWAKMKPRTIPRMSKLKDNEHKDPGKDGTITLAHCFPTWLGVSKYSCLPVPSKNYSTGLAKQDLRYIHLKKVPKPGSPTWWCRKILNSLSPMDTPNLQLHLEQFPLKMTWKLAEQLCHIKRERSISKWVEEAEARSHQKFFPPCGFV